MFSLSLLQTARLYRPRITPPCWRLEITEGWSHLEYALPLWVGAPVTEITTIRKATAERVRLHRERRRRGLRCQTIEIRNREIDALVRHGLLDGEKRDDTAAIRVAFHQYLDHTLGLR